MKFINLPLVVAISLLFGCSDNGGSSSQQGYDPIYKTRTITSATDPLRTYQWYLDNQGQHPFASNGGISGEDMDVVEGSFSLSNYALGMTGRGIQVAVVDTGLEIAHPDLQENISPLASYNFANNGLGLHDPSPTSTGGDHGTSAAGLLGGRGGNSQGIWGTAPAVSLRGYNLLQADLLSDELASLGEPSAAASYPEMTSQDVAIFNRSYGTNPYQEIPPNQYNANILPIMEALAWGAHHLRQGKGAFYLKAAGNEYYGGAVFSDGWCDQAIQEGVTCYNANMETENNTPNQIVIGAFNANGERSSYSNTGSSLWVSAPGGEFGEVEPALLTVDLSGCDKGYSRSSNVQPSNAFNLGQVSENAQCNYFSAFNGTSGATPIASGAVALILEANPTLTFRDVKYILAKTVRQLDENLAPVYKTIGNQSVLLDQGWVVNAAGFHFSNAYGFGAIDVIQAIRLAQSWKALNKHLSAEKSVPEIVDQPATAPVVPDNDPNGLSRTLSVSETGNVETVTIHLTIKATETGTYPKIDNSDYQVILTSPSGTQSVLLTPYNAYQSGHNMEDLMLSSHAFYGEPITGDWILTVKDLDNSTQNRTQSSGVGALVKWSLTMTARDE